jgi:hypothetical protein
MLNGPPMPAWPAPSCANQGKRLVNDGRRPRLGRNAPPIPVGVGGLLPSLRPTLGSAGNEAGGHRAITSADDPYLKAWRANVESPVPASTASVEHLASTERVHLR